MFVDPWRKIFIKVANYYMSHPDLVANIMERIGSRNVISGSREIRCTCPLHDGGNPNGFVVWMDHGFIGWRCYTEGCGSGNLATLLMKKYNVGFPQAVTWLAHIAGIKIDGPSLHISPEQMQSDLDEEPDRTVTIDADSRHIIFPDEWVRQAQSNWNRPEGVEAIHMLTGRYGEKTASGDKCKQFSWKILQEFEVGVVPGGNWVMTDPSDPSRKNGWFENRIAIPWRNLEGKCIGFSGRRYDGQKYLKYKTFPGTKKSTCLYGLFSDKCRKAISTTGEIVIVEGFSDVWRAWSHEIYNVISPGGTELSLAQIRLLQMFDLDHVTFFYDGDEAGQVTSRKMADQIKNVTKVRIGSPPDGCDPDDMMTPDQYMAGINEAKPF